MSDLSRNFTASDEVLDRGASVVNWSQGRGDKIYRYGLSLTFFSVYNIMNWSPVSSCRILRVQFKFIGP